MEPREVQGPAPAGGGLHVQQPQHMVMGPTYSSYLSNSALITPNPTANFPPSAPRFPLNSVGFDGSSQFRYNTEPAMIRKKRGRPRKYAADGNIALAPPANHDNGDSVGLGSSSGSGAASEPEPPLKKSRGRPPGSSKRQIDALGS